MDEDQIERRAERQMEALDRAYLTTGMTEAQYQRKVEAIDLVVNRLLQSARRVRSAG